VTLKIEARSIVGLIGPNGAGKTTLLNALSGFVALSKGAVWLGGLPMSGRRPFEFSRAGIARTFQNVRLFRDQTVLDNLIVPALSRGISVRTAESQALEILEWAALRPLGARRAAELSYGEERLVGIARALALRPAFLLLDEPAAGMGIEECKNLGSQVRQIPDAFDCAVVLIEHNMDLVMRTCESIHVLVEGQTLTRASPAEIHDNPRVRAAYLGQPSA
jgi:branched-chain amino acid transport system ATP-binding protein